MAHLCLSVQSLSGKSGTRPGGHALFAIMIWLTAGQHDSVTAHVSASPRKSAPEFTGCRLRHPAACHAHGTTTYSLERLVAGRIAFLRARVGVPAHTSATQIRLTVHATSPQASHSASVAGTVAIRAARRAAPSAVPTPGGVGSTLPPGLSPLTLPNAGAGASLPTLPGPQPNAGAAFPALTPPTPSPVTPTPVTLPGARRMRVADVSAIVPLNMRLIGGQIIGLAVLAMAVTIAVARIMAHGRPGRRSRRSG